MSETKEIIEAIQHVLRNPWGHSEIERKSAHLAAADALDSYTELIVALKTLVDDVQQYEAWQRPCYALDKARAALAKAKGEK